MRLPRCVFSLGCLALLAAVGCGDGKTTVGGTITFDDKPVEQGAITFFPTDGKSPTSGSVVENGKYFVKDATPGDMRVVITASKPSGKKKKLYDTPTSPTVDEMVEALPAKFSNNEKTELTFTVPSGAATKNFDLKSK